jgi:hypothetical protein
MVEWGQALRKNGYTVLDAVDTETLKVFEFHHPVPLG